ncbi:hypothetical protein H0H93_001604, partial [Arthromyces matolae]
MDGYQLALISRVDGSPFHNDWNYVPIALDRPKYRDSDPTWISLNNAPLEPLRKALEGRLQGRDVNQAYLALHKTCSLGFYPEWVSTGITDAEIKDFIGGSVILDESHAPAIM